MIKVDNKTYTDCAAALKIKLLEKQNKLLNHKIANLKDRIGLLEGGADGLLLLKIHCQYTTGCRNIIDYVKVEHGVASINIVFDVPEPRASVNIGGEEDG